MERPATHMVDQRAPNRKPVGKVFSQPRHPVAGMRPHIPYHACSSAGFSTATCNWARFWHARPATIRTLQAIPGTAHGNHIRHELHRLYLKQSSEGLFVGVGIVFLLWTLISLIGNVEDTFNLIWGQKNGRSIWRKLSDYTAMLLILPILMICASGLSILLSSTLNAIFNFEFMTPVIAALLEGAQCLMTFLFFTAVYMLIPNTKVKFKNAFISGTISGIGFLVLQWLFVTGTLYVTKYNAIYGSFAFIPLLLLWMQLAWVICLAGAVICYSSQNVFAFSLSREVESISAHYRDKVTVAITSVIAFRFVKRLGPASARDLMDTFELPAQLVTSVTDRLCAAGICNRVLIPDQKEVYGFQLAIDPDQLTVGELRRALYNLGTSDFINDFPKNFPKVLQTFVRLDNAFNDVADSIPVVSLIDNIPTTSKP